MRGMLLTILFAAAIIVAVVLKYLVPRKERCPECLTIRQEDEPLCTECGWMYDAPGTEDEDYGESPEAVDDLPPELR